MGPRACLSVLAALGGSLKHKNYNMNRKLQMNGILIAGLLLQNVYILHCTSYNPPRTPRISEEK